MRQHTKRLGMAGLAGCLLAGLTTIATQAAPESDDWNRQAAATYLDTRQAWWIEWPTAARDRGTVCVSCHTAAPYAIARTALRTEGTAPGPVERRLLESVETRVTAWHDVKPFYSDEQYTVPKTSESRGTEAILNVLILANRDARAGTLTPPTRQALDNLWGLQLAEGEATGAWPWLNFGLEPWEGPTGQYYGAALAAVAVGRAPGRYASTPRSNRTWRGYAPICNAKPTRNRCSTA